MTIEARATLPAGWYTDPGQSGGKRWWDGIKWTEHLQLAAAPKTAAARPTSNPYGLNGVGVVSSAPRAPMTGENAVIAHVESVLPVSNRAAWLSLVFGIIALGLTVATFLPGPQTYWVVGAGIIAFLFGVRALVRLRTRSATIVWAPIIGIVLGIVAALSMILGVNVVGLIGTSDSQTASATSAPAADSFPTTSAEPLVFPKNAQLTTDETTAQSLATAINRTYAAGNARLQPGQAWPTSLTVSGTSVVAPNGVAIAQLPAGVGVDYTLSSDGTSYHIAVSADRVAELATYNSNVNGFSWNCATSDTNCTPAS